METKGTTYIAGGYNPDYDNAHCWTVLDNFKKLVPFKSVFNCTEDGRIGFVATNLYRYAEQINPRMYSFGQYLMVFSGVLYNREDIIKDIIFSKEEIDLLADGEIFLLLFLEKGLDALAMINGCFAFGLYDSVSKKITIGCDHMGQEQLYFYHRDRFFYFASEPKQIFNVVPAQWRNLDSVVHIETPLHSETSFSYVYAVKPGSVVVFDCNECRLHEYTYWSLVDQVAKQQYELSMKDDNVLREMFLNLLTDAIDIRLKRLSCRSVGAFLSGGQDSSFITGYIAKYTPYKISNAYTVGFSSMGVVYNEFSWAAIAASAIKSNHILIEPDSGEFIDDYPWVTYVIGDVQANAAHFAEFLVYKKAFEHNDDIVFSGYGADEALGGEIRYLLVAMDENRTSLQHTIEQNALLKQYAPLAKKLWQIGERDTDFEKYWHLVCRSDSKKESDTKALARSCFESLPQINDDRNFVSRAGYFDITFLGNNMISSGKLARAYGIQKICPFLDYRLQAFALALPLRLKLDLVKVATKIILRDISTGIVPEEITNRPNKVGFSFPYTQSPFVEFLSGLADAYRKRDNVYSVVDRVRGYYDRAVRVDATRELLHRLFVD